MSNRFWHDVVPRVNLLRSRHSRIAHIEFTSHCNLRCVFCSATQPDYRGKHIDEGILPGVIQLLKTRHPKIVCVNGHGETTIYKNWHLYCGQLLEDGFELHIISNFSRQFSEQEIEILARFSSIEISCDSADPELFKKLRRGADLATILDNIKRVQAISERGPGQSPLISFSCVVSDQTVFGLQDLIALAISYRIRRFSFCNLVKLPQVAGALQVNHITELPYAEMVKARQSLQAAFEFMNSSRIEFFCQQGLIDSLEQKIRSLETAVGVPVKATEMKPAEAEHPEPLRYAAAVHKNETRDCLDPWSFFMIQSDGDVLPCCWHHPIGSLSSSHPVEEIFRGRLLQELRFGLLTGNLHPECRNCPSRGLIGIDELKKKVIHYLNPKTGLLLSRIKTRVRLPFREWPIEYLEGWFPEEEDSHWAGSDWGKWRWISRHARFRFANPLKRSSLIIQGLTAHTKLSDHKITIKVNGVVLEDFIPSRPKFFREYTLGRGILGTDGCVAGGIDVDKAFVPSRLDPQSTDHRELSVQIFRFSLASS